MKLIPIRDVHDPQLRDYQQLTDVQLRKLREPSEGLYIAESSKVILRALTAGHIPRSVLVTEAWLEPLRTALDAYPDIPIFIGDEDQLEVLTGFHLHRGALASIHRPALKTIREVVDNAKTIVILEGLADHTNVGAVFRTAAALGVDAVLVSETCADPFYRRAVRVSMGATLQVPWTRMGEWSDAITLLHDLGFETAGFALGDGAVDLGEFVRRSSDSERRMALVFGAEGPGISRGALATLDTLVNIPMHHGIDSLNVSTAAGIAIWSVLHK